MISEKESLEIDIQDRGGTCKSRNEKMSVDEEGYLNWVWRIAWDLTDEDSKNGVKFSLKVGLAVLLVSILVLIRAPSDVFGTNIVWSILTVAVMFEYTVGATFKRGFNRALGSLLAGILAIGVGQLALRAGRNVEPVLIGVSIFLIGVITSFMKLWPSMEPYEHGLRVVLFTYCVIVVSGYRMGNPIQTAMERLYSIAIGGIVASLVNVLVFPTWAGQQLHMELVDGFNAVADSLEECVKKYLEDEEIDLAELCKVVSEEFPDEMAAYQKCKATLSSSAKLQSLADAAKWEPPHDRFKNYFHPWSDYIKVGAVLRHSAYGVMALHCVLNSEIQAPHARRITFKSEMREATSHATELLRTLANDINNMKTGDKTSLLKSSDGSMERLQTAINIHWQTLMAQPLDNSSWPVTKQSNKSREMETSKTPKGTETYHEMMRKNPRRLRIKECERIGSLSVTSFVTLLLELIARLDHLVDAVDELSISAKFNQEAAW
ncbi:PREDICTED: aluminum-activated malate transporter 9-like [Tarenaya hassleriana]|uniref:aluminum-activated malate transporter 9-like n=1 Tax=Tarenaya hassleriana TaxID=28532 RepID=UPI00053C9960|nr:PREDICTED: aluminum-activated malate transporter 9-like [Tarenaya hassleriana]